MKTILDLQHIMIIVMWNLHEINYNTIQCNKTHTIMVVVVAVVVVVVVECCSNEVDSGSTVEDSKAAARTVDIPS